MVGFGRNLIQQENYMKVKNSLLGDCYLIEEGDIIFLYEFINEEGYYKKSSFYFSTLADISKRLKDNTFDKLMTNSDDLPVLCTMNDYLDITCLCKEQRDALIECMCN